MGAALSGLGLEAPRDHQLNRCDDVDVDDVGVGGDHDGEDDSGDDDVSWKLMMTLIRMIIMTKYMTRNNDEDNDD